MTFRLRCTGPKVERVKALVRKMIRSGATMRKTQRRETHRACRRRRGLRNGIRRQAKRDLVYACVTSRILVRALHQIKRRLSEEEIVIRPCGRISPCHVQYA